MCLNPWTVWWLPAWEPPAPGAPSSREVSLDGGQRLRVLPATPTRPGSALYHNSVSQALLTSVMWRQASPLRQSQTAATLGNNKPSECLKSFLFNILNPALQSFKMKKSCDPTNILITVVLNPHIYSHQFAPLPWLQVFLPKHSFATWSVQL